MTTPSLLQEEGLLLGDNNVTMYRHALLQIWRGTIFLVPCCAHPVHINVQFINLESKPNNDFREKK